VYSLSDGRIMYMVRRVGLGLELFSGSTLPYFHREMAILGGLEYYSPIVKNVFWWVGSDLDLSSVACCQFPCGNEEK